MTPEKSRYMQFNEFSKRNRLKTIAQYREEPERASAPSKMSGSSGISNKQNGQPLSEKQRSPQSYATKSQNNKAEKTVMELAMEQARQNKEGKR
jgi:hypothetical protein